MTSDEESKIEKAKLYLEEAHAFFDFTNETRKKIDDKIHNMIALSAVLVNILFGAGYFLVQEHINRTQSTLLLLVFSTLSYFTVIVIGIINYSPVKIAARNIKKVIQQYELGEIEYQFAAPYQHIAWNLSKDAEENSRKIDHKAYWLRIMMFVFMSGIAFLIFALGLLVFGF